MPRVLRGGDFVGGDQHRPQRAEGVKALAADPLAATAVELPLAGRDVVGARVSEHVTEGVGPRHIAGGPADHHRKFALVVNFRAAATAGWQQNRVARAADCARGLGKDDGLLGRFEAGFGRVLAVV